MEKKKKIRLLYPFLNLNLPFLIIYKNKLKSTPDTVVEQKGKRRDQTEEEDMAKKT